MPEYEGPERQILAEEEYRALYREHLRVYNERLKMEIDKLPVLITGQERIEAKVDGLSKLLVGNGDVKGSVMYRLTMVEDSHEQMIVGQQTVIKGIDEIKTRNSQVDVTLTTLRKVAVWITAVVGGLASIGALIIIVKNILQLF